MTAGSWAIVVASVMPLVACREGAPPQAIRADLVRETAVPTLNGGVARVYHVAPEGSETGSGSISSPFKSVQQAADLAQAGDTVLVHPGVYTGGERMVTVTRSGEPGRWITFLSQQKWRATIDGRNGASLEAWYFGPGVGYVRVEGFEIKDLHEHGFDTYGGAVHDLVIARNLVHHIGRNCTDTSNGRTGASLGAETRRVTFDGNIWHDIGRLAPGELGCSPQSKYYQNHDHGIYVADADQITVVNNVFYEFARGWAIHRYYSRGGFARELRIGNNTFVGANPYRPGQIILATPTEGLRIENNIFYSPNSAALYFENLPFPESVVRNNLVYGGDIAVGQPRNVTFAKNREGMDPRFIAPSNFRLAEGSPAIDAGIPLTYSQHDADGAPRPRGQGYDLGAYEH
jgi:Right handed beta helix region